MEVVGWGRAHRNRFRVQCKRGWSWPVGVCAVGFGVCAFELVGRCWVVMVCGMRWLHVPSQSFSSPFCKRGWGWPVGVWAVGIGVGAFELVGQSLCCRD